MSQSEYERTTRKQVATNELSAAARLDRETEVRLYALYRAYFRRGEEVRRWVVWSDIAWDETRPEPSRELVDAMWTAYQEDAFLPDYSARSMQVLRASRGRAWFLTRWSYEEGKHLLGRNEWMIRSGAATGEEVRDAAEALLHAFRWEPAEIDGVYVFADFLAWELHQIARDRALLALATAENDPALVQLLAFLVRENEQHRDFFRESLAIIAENYPEQVAAAVKRVADAQSDPEIAVGLYAALGLSAS